MDTRRYEHSRQVPVVAIRSIAILRANVYTTAVSLIVMPLDVSRFNAHLSAHIYIYMYFGLAWIGYCLYYFIHLR